MSMLVDLFLKCGIVVVEVKLIEEFDMKGVVDVFLIFFIIKKGKYLSE